MRSLRLVALLLSTTLLGCQTPKATSGVVADTAGTTRPDAVSRPGIDTGVQRTELAGYLLRSPPSGPSRALWVYRLIRGDSVELRVTVGGPGPREERTIYSSGTLPLPDGCMAMQASLPAVRDLMVPGYALIAVVEDHYYDDDCIANEKADTSWVTFLDAARGFRRVLKLNGDLYRVESANNRLGSGGGETWDNVTTALRQTIFRTDHRGLHVTIRDQVDSAGNTDYLMVWNGDSTKLVRSTE